MTAQAQFQSLLAAMRACRACDLPHGARPVVQLDPRARLVIISQAPGARVHASGVPFQDDSGDRLRDWLGIDAAVFHDPAQVALLPMGLCYPGKARGGDLPPRRECAPLWHGPALGALAARRLVLLVGVHAQAHYLPALRGLSLAERVRRTAGSDMPALPHPAWRSRLWMAAHPWFAERILPPLRARIAAALADQIPSTSLMP